MKKYPLIKEDKFGKKETVVKIEAVSFRQAKELAIAFYRLA